MTGEAHAVDHVLTYVYRARFDYKTLMEKRPPSTIEQLIMWVRCFAADFSNHARNVQYVGHPIQPSKCTYFFRRSRGIIYSFLPEE